jgi:CO/xanthine dehydrogenase Mo-binding subunit
MLETLAGGAPNVQLWQVGKPLIRKDAPNKAYGNTLYAGDLMMPGMLHAKVFRADRPSAKIVRIDATKARALAGVRCVLTAWDLPDRLVVTDIPGQTGGKTKNTAQPILAKERVRFFNEPIALIAADTEEIAAAARDLIEVEYAALPGVFDPVEALRPGAPQVDGDANVVAAYRIRKGDVARGFAEADFIVENRFRTQVQEQAFLEPEAGLAWIDDKDVLNIKVSTQVVEHFRAVADALGIPHNRVHVEAMYVGGGFGGKEGLTIEMMLALLAYHTHRPVRLILTREESFVNHGNRHPFTLEYRTGVKKDGKITALEVRLTADSGAYSKLSPYVLLYATVGAPGPYRVDNLKVDSVVAATNNLSTCAFRGFGTMQACVAYEGQMDEIAKRLGMSPLELRRRNFIQTGDKNATGQTIESAVWSEQCAVRALEALGAPARGDDVIKIGRGLACYQQSYGRIRWFKDSSEAWVGIEVDGTVIVRCAVTDIGAGQSSSLAQIAAEVLGVPMEKVVTYFGDCTLNPLAGTSSASRALYMSGNATKLAATKVRENLLEWAAKHFAVSPDELQLADFRVFVVDDPSRSMPIDELARKCAADGVHRHHLAMFRAPTSEGLDPETGQGDVFPDFTFGAHACEVAVDTETGEVTVLKSVGAHDVGQSLNPQSVAGQIEGSALMGQGFALCEEIVQRNGVLATPSFSEYLIPTAEDVPDIKAIILESRSGLGPFGAKGMGEPAFAPVAASIANAVADALGVRVFELPITPERVIDALARKEANTANAPRSQSA